MLLSKFQSFLLELGPSLLKSTCINFCISFNSEKFLEDFNKQAEKYNKSRLLQELGTLNRKVGEKIREVAQKIDILDRTNELNISNLSSVKNYLSELNDLYKINEELRSRCHKGKKEIQEIKLKQQDMCK